MALGPLLIILGAGAALLGATGCARASGAPLPAVAEAGSLEDSLRREVGHGGTVALVADRDGLVAVSADGAGRRLLAEGRVRNVLVDDRARVTWFVRARADGRGADLLALDLARPAAPPVPIAEGLGSLQSVGVRHARPRESLAAGPGDATWLILEGGDGGRPRFEHDVEAGGRTRRVPCRAPEPLGECPAWAPGAEARLAQWTLRAAGRRLYPPWSAGRLPRVKAAAVRGCAHCGEARAVPGTKLWAVQAMVQGDDCHVVPELFDPAARAFIDWNDGARSAEPLRDAHAHFHDAWICPAGDAFVSQGRLHRFSGGAVATVGPAAGGGCLGGGWHFAGEEARPGCPR